MSSQDFNNALETLREAFEARDFAEVLIQGSQLLKHPEMKALQKADFVLPGSFYFDLQSFLQKVVTTEDGCEWNSSLWYQVTLYCAQSAHALKDYVRSDLFMERLIRQARSPVFLHLKGRWLYERGLVNDALKAWHQALALDANYLPVYEDIVTLANAAQLPEEAFAMIQLASTYRMTPRLFEELLLAASKTDFISMRSLFLELCVQHISPQTVSLLRMLLSQLYNMGDYHHSHYLGFHLLLVYAEDTDIRSLYLFSALHQKQYGQALQVLFQLPESVKDSLYYYQVGQVFLRWNMPLFAREFFAQALKLLEGASSDVKEQIKSDYYRLKAEAEKPSEGDSIKAFIKRMGVDKRFKQRFLDHFQETLLDYHLPVTSSWQKLHKMMQMPMI